MLPRGRWAGMWSFRRLFIQVYNTIREDHCPVSGSVTDVHHSRRDIGSCSSSCCT
ncbi:hypothetical protein LSH36_94g05004 [Paralvinella palmiformis]|uniref:Uncharacterized protein n=1 Tax=Paralvinella palmiformis TaxID=53620 RepID=A0AAD9NA96_9ANNE|nr:hypothetical protein LSH36_94g05004 [Paralvinella palmiformis]